MAARTQQNEVDEDDLEPEAEAVAEWLDDSVEKPVA